jgi:predicted nucleic acid-binding protein
VAIAHYLVDTSAWTRRTDRAVARQLVPLIGAGLVATCSILDAEALYTSRSPGDYEQLRLERLYAYEFLVADQEVWDRVLDVQRELARRSMTRAVGINDLVISAVAERHRATVLHYDADFDHVAGVTGQEMEWVVPRGSVS